MTQQRHSISEDHDGQRSCSCGEKFPDAISALTHALPLNLNNLVEDMKRKPHD